MHGSTTYSRKRTIAVVVCSVCAPRAFSFSTTTRARGDHKSYPHCHAEQARIHHSRAQYAGMASPVGSIGGKHDSAETQNKMDRAGARPHPGTSVERRASAAEEQGIIFVGEKSALNSQPVPPQRSVHTSTQRGDPAGRTPGPLSKNPVENHS